MIRKFIQVFIYVGLFILFLAENVLTEWLSVRRIIMLLTLGNILWSYYLLLKDPSKPIRIIVMAVLKSVIAIILVAVILIQYGW